MQIISLSASANKLSNIQKQAQEYAALIMEELDPENVGYIMVRTHTFISNNIIINFCIYIYIYIHAVANTIYMRTMLYRFKTWKLCSFKPRTNR